MKLKGTGPRILWERRTGRIHSANNIIAGANTIFFGTCGHRWNHADSEDGVSGLDRQTGDLVWFTPTGSDVNRIVEVGKHLVCLTDLGDIFILNAASGVVAKVYRFDAAALSKPLIWENGKGWVVIAISALGTVYRLDLAENGVAIVGHLNDRVRADIAAISSQEERAFIVKTESGAVMSCKFSGSLFTSHILRRVTYQAYRVSAEDTGVETASVIHAAPAIDGRRLYIGFVRNSYYSEPPIICLDAITGETIWAASRSPQGRFGNCRATPLIVDSYLVAAFAYSDSLHIFDKANGGLLAAVKVGPSVFQQWSAPVSCGSDHVLLGRVDGVVSIVDVRAQKLVASISLATREVRLGSVDDGRLGQAYALTPGRRPLGICGTPTVLDDVIFVGTTSGGIVEIELGI